MKPKFKRAQNFQTNTNYEWTPNFKRRPNFQSNPNYKWIQNFKRTPKKPKLWMNPKI